MRHTSSKPDFLSALDADVQYTYTTTIGNRVCVRGRHADGRGVYVEQKYQPTYYLPSDTYTGIESIDHHPLRPHACVSIRDGKNFLERHPDAFGDIQPEYMLLSDVYGATEMLPDMSRLYLWNIDIEVDSEDAFAPPEDPFNPITTITVMWRHANQQGIVAYGLHDYTPTEDVTYVQCESEEALLETFLRDWRGKGDYPDIITGWNVQFFDIPYIVNRVRRLMGEDAAMRLSPFKQITERQSTLNGRTQIAMDLRGVAILDYYELYRKFTFSQQESYRLDHIAHVELGKRKLSYAEYQSLSHLYRANYQKYMDYNIEDVRLVAELDDKMKLIDLVCALAYSAKANYTDTFKQVRLWDIMIYHYLRGRNQQIPPRRQVDKTEQYEGAYVKDPQVGRHDWVCSFDVASMYPHIIRQWNLSPESLIGRKVSGITVENLLAKEDVSAHLADEQVPEGYAMSANGVLTHRQPEGFLPAMLKTLYDERTRFKSLATAAKKQREGLPKDDPQYALLTQQISAYNNQQMVRKVNLNSAYGALGSNYFRFYDTDMAEAVTVTGQFVIQLVAKRINEYLNKVFKTQDDYVVASDTDSVYVRLAGVVHRYQKETGTTDLDALTTFVDRFCEQRMQVVIDKTFDEIAAYLNVSVPCLSMKREVIASKAVWTAKKRYVLDCRDTEGVRHHEPKLKVMGLEVVKSSTPAICRGMMMQVLTLMLRQTQEDIWSYVAKQRCVFDAARFEEVAFPRSVNSLSKYQEQDKSLPIAVRGAIMYNKHIGGLHGNYERIRSGQKIKFAYLRVPNRFQTNIMSAPDGCPTEWRIETILDYETQWQKAFIEPMQAVLTCIGWSVEKQDVLF